MSQFDFKCVVCGGTMKVDLASGKIKCIECGAFLGEPPNENTPLELDRGVNKPRRAMTVTHRGEVNHWAKAAFDTACDHIERGESEPALKALRRALENQPDFTDAHLWIAKLSSDEKTKRDHLSTIIAQDPTHAEAIRMLMVLNGRLTEEQAERSYGYDELKAQIVDEAVTTQTTVLLCPVCEGHLTIDDETGRVQCRFCGYVGTKAEQPQYQTINEDSLTMALIERRATPIRWVIGKRLLHCNECGAERTIPGRTLSMVCPFCGSNQVIVQDALKSFRQPDGLVPFVISREQAMTSIGDKLQGLGERFKSLFDNNRVKQTMIDGVYLPFWVFDTVVDVTKNTRYKQAGSARRISITVQPTTTERFTDMLNNVAVPAIMSPPPELAARLGKWPMDAMVPYEPKLLAKYPAELYSIDFDKGGLNALGMVSKEMKSKHSISYGESVEITIFSAVRQMTFQLALMPVWVATLIEVDGDVRAALVNGQTGEVALGQTQKKK